MRNVIGLTNKMQYKIVLLYDQHVFWRFKLFKQLINDLCKKCQNGL